MSSYHQAKAPLLSLTIPQSPLLSGPLSEHFCYAMAAQGISTPLPGLSFASSSGTKTLRFNRLSGQPQLDIKGYISESGLDRDKPLPSTPVNAIPAKQIISLLELLERVDEDIAKEVQRVREGIREAFMLVDEYVNDQKERSTQQQERRAREQRETKGIDDDFWLNA